MKRVPRVPRSLQVSRGAGGSRMRGSGSTVTHLEKAPLEGHLAAAGELTIQATKSTLRRRTRILLVNADRSQLHQLEATLLANGYGVVSASTFKAALELLEAIAPDMLVADVRLEAYNGLHLATRSRCHCPSRPVIVTHGAFDPVLDM